MLFPVHYCRFTVLRNLRIVFLLFAVYCVLFTISTGTNLEANAQSLDGAFPEPACEARMGASESIKKEL